MIQGNFGARGNFEIVGPAVQGGFFHGFRNNDTPGFPWSVNPSPFDAQREIRGISLIQSSFGNLEAVALVLVTPPTGSGPLHPVPYYVLVHYSRDTAGNWNLSEIADAGDIYNPTLNVNLPPAFIQSRFGTAGNFEVIGALAQGGLAHCWRDNDAPGTPWSALSPIGTNHERFDAVALIHSSFGNLEVVARTGNRLVHFWRDSASTWQEPRQGMDHFFSGAAGSHGFIQSRYGTAGNFELVTPLQAGGLRHLFRANDDPTFPWIATQTFGAADVPNGGRVALIQSTFGTPNVGNLEVAVLVPNQPNRFLHYWRRDTGDTWSATPTIIATP